VIRVALGDDAVVVARPRACALVTHKSDGDAANLDIRGAARHDLAAVVVGIAEADYSPAHFFNLTHLAHLGTKGASILFNVSSSSTEKIDLPILAVPSNGSSAAIAHKKNETSSNTISTKVKALKSPFSSKIEAANGVRSSTPDHP
jgi:hypothetical protein